MATGSSTTGIKRVKNPAFNDLLEKRYFQFFRQRTVASTNSIANCRFWDRVVLQACHTTPAVKHAVLALSSLHQLSSLPFDDGRGSQHRIYAERQHKKALEEARTLIATSTPEDVDRILIACIIFIIFEGVRGDYTAVSVHMDSGRAIVAQHLDRLKATSRRKDLEEIEHALARLDLPAICFSDQSSPYRYTLMDFYHTSPFLTPCRFQDIHEAQVSLVDLARWLLLAGDHIDFAELHGDLRSMAKYQAEKVKCAAQVEEWYGHFLDAVDRTDNSDRLLILTLKLWHSCMTMLIRAETYGPEMRYDAFMPLFERTVQYGEQIVERLADRNHTRSFSLELGYIIPIYVTATRCRDPYLRRRAIDLLQKHPRQEGVWKSLAAAAVASRWVAVEEEGLGQVRYSTDVPEHRRIRFIDTQVDIEGKVASVKLTTRGGEKSHEVSAGWKSESAHVTPN
ncbi:hypothetical protein LTR37_008580 [Vermiconidia calcicola]|uniref:Uncharacterized protein n=1 Tax=Vermiconidia calcicola TaxID=1690605 RepID=A0ACC3NAS5_9PEZI|nr:hypothetical protein LTR37_008580 [Vermiconidia calcicola]